MPYGLFLYWALKMWWEGACDITHVYVPDRSAYLDGDARTHTERVTLPQLLSVFCSVLADFWVTSLFTGLPSTSRRYVCSAKTTQSYKNKHVPSTLERPTLTVLLSLLMSSRRRLDFNEDMLDVAVYSRSLTTVVRHFHHTFHDIRNAWSADTRKLLRSLYTSSHQYRLHSDV